MTDALRPGALVCVHTPNYRNRPIPRTALEVLTTRMTAFRLSLARYRRQLHARLVVIFLYFARVLVQHTHFICVVADFWTVRQDAKKASLLLSQRACSLDSHVTALV